MKARSIKLAACLLAGVVILSGGVAPAYAANTGSESSVALAGTSLALTEIEEEPASELAQDAEEQAEVLEKQAAETEDTSAEDEQYANIGIAQVNDYVNVRSTASTDGEVVGQMENGAAAVVEGTENGWYKITSGSISGYVSADYLVVGNAELVKSVQKRIAVVNTDSLKVRKEASTEAGVMMLVGTGERLEVLDESIQGWVKVSTSEGEGYVSTDYVSLEDSYLYAKEPQEVSGGAAVIDYAMQFIGNPYVWGGTSLTNGADCSGFIMSVYAHFGVSLPHSSASLRGVGREVSYSEAQPGDIICYSGHVALYIGNGQVVHAANERLGITTSSATHKSILTVRRIFN